MLTPGYDPDKELALSGTSSSGGSGVGALENRVVPVVNIDGSPLGTVSKSSPAGSRWCDSQLFYLRGSTIKFGLPALRDHFYNTNHQFDHLL